MGFFSSIIGGVTGLISGGKRRKEAAKQRAHDLQQQTSMMRAQSEQRAHEARLAQMAQTTALSGVNKNNKTSFIPWAIGGGIAVVGVLVAVLIPKKRRR